MSRTIQSLSVALLTLFSASIAYAEPVSLAKAVVVIRSGELPAAEKVSSTILTEEITKRTGVTWNVTSDWPSKAETVIAISTLSQEPSWKKQIANSIGAVPRKNEGYAIMVTAGGEGRPTVVSIVGHDPRGAMFGVGKFLRSVDWKSGEILIDSAFKVAESPDRPLRGHQIGYRDTANSWDAWSFDQFDQYFRDMVIFGANAVENIPFQEDKLNPLMKYPREQMNIKFAEICEKYDLEHWIWVPVMIDLPNAEQEAKFLEDQDRFYSKIKRLDAVFVPGGDPGDNDAKDLLPYLERMAEVMTKHHPKAKLWLSLQHHLNKPGHIDLVYDFIEQKKPKWFGGLAMGPGSPAMDVTRRRLPQEYKLRWYPDITHVVRCQYPVPWLDPVLGMTLGREPVNPRPVDYTAIYRMDYAFTDGFLTYSDGVHDDFNKNLWTQLGWNPNIDPRDVARDYARFFFRPEVTEEATDGLFALESDARGALAENGAVGATFELWKRLEEKVLDAGSKWRFRMHLFRAYYAYYTRNRLKLETELERQALELLGTANKTNILLTMKAASEILNRSQAHQTDRELYDRLLAFGDELFQDIGLQTSVPKYHASGAERGAVLDFIDYPLNNRWWLEDQFVAIERMVDSDKQLKRIEIIRNWENPGEGGYYDVLGEIGRSPRIPKLLLAGDMMRHRTTHPNPTQRWMQGKRNGLRVAWNNYLNTVPSGIDYNGIDPKSSYVVKLFARKESPLLIDGAKAKLISKGETFDQVTEQLFEVPTDATQDGKITLSWEKLDESHLNWREWHYVTDIWVMKKAK